MDRGPTGYTLLLQLITDMHIMKKLDSLMCESLSLSLIGDMERSIKRTET